MLLGVSGYPSGRVPLLPDVGFCALVGVLPHAGFVRVGTDSSMRAGLRVAGAGLLVLVHLVLAPLSSLRVTKKLVHEARRTEAIAHHIAQVEFDSPLDAPELSLLVWRDGALRRFMPPTVGESVEVAWSPGPSVVL